MSKDETTTLDKIQLGLAAISERLMGVNSIIPDKEHSRVEVEKIKSVETSRLMTSFNQLLKLQASILGEMKDSGELISIPRQAFVEIFTEAITDAKTNEEKIVVQKILDDLKKLANVNFR